MSDILPDMENRAGHAVPRPSRLEVSGASTIAAIARIQAAGGRVLVMEEKRGCSGRWILRIDWPARPARLI